MANARALRKAAEALDALNTGTTSVELPPGAIFNPTREQIDAKCRLLGIKPPPPQEISKGGCSPVFMMASKAEDLFTLLGGRRQHLALHGGRLPASCDIKDQAGNKVAQFRATGRQTIVRGIHKSGKRYGSNGYTPLSMRHEEIVWPDDFILPWVADAVAPVVEPDSLDAQLRVECGAPFVISKRGGVQINHAYFVRRFCLKHRVLFETTDGAFYLYEESSGVWRYVDAGVPQLARFTQSDARWQKRSRLQGRRVSPRRGRPLLK
jgi:hypothetical protein